MNPRSRAVLNDSRWFAGFDPSKRVAILCLLVSAIGCQKHEATIVSEQPALSRDSGSSNAPQPSPKEDAEIACHPLCVPTCPGASVASTQISLNTGTSTENVRYPRFAFRNGATADAVERIVAARLNDERKAYERMERLRPKGCDPSLNIMCRSVFASDELVSIGCLEEAELCAAHPSRDIVTINLVVRSDGVHLLRLGDLFDATKSWRQDVGHIFETKIRERMRALLGAERATDDQSDDSAANAAGTLGPFMISCHGIDLVDTDLGFAIGPLDATLSWTELSPWLGPRGADIQRSTE